MSLMEAMPISTKIHIKLEEAIGNRSKI